MDRRTFLELTGLAVASMSATPADSAESNGEPTVKRVLDTQEYTDYRIRLAKQSMPFDAKTQEEAQTLQPKMRAKLVELLGGFPEKVDLAPEIVETHEFDAYTLEKIYFQSRENLTVKAYMVLPKKFEKPGRCMVCIPGHGRGVDDIVGINEDGSFRKEKEGYQFDFALQCAEHGLAALAIEPFGFGDRRSERAKKEGAGASSCNPTAGIALMLGETMVGWRVWDVMRSVDYLLTRPEIDPKRIGAMGISGGGTATFWSACVDPRIQVAFVSGYYCTFDHCIMAVPHCVDNYIPGIYKVADMPEFSGLVAPRPMFVESGIKDDIFLIDGVKTAVARAKEIYKVFGVEDRVDSEHFEGEHSFHGKGGFEFIDKWL